jgi:hypothetical protein
MSIAYEQPPRIVHYIGISQQGSREPERSDAIKADASTVYCPRFSDIDARLASFVA